MPTFTFEGHYKDGEGNRCDIIVAPDRNTALKLAGIALMVDNEWTDGRLGDDQCLSDFYTEEVEIDSDWSDLEGMACPNCTAHGGRHNGGILGPFGRQMEVFECSLCHYEWIPLGKSKTYTEPTLAEIESDIAEFVKEQRVIAGYEDDAKCRTEDCDGDPDDGDGFDGYCGNCADKNEGEDDNG